MLNQLFIEINKFDEWAQFQSAIPQDRRFGEWECDYNHWNGIYEEFEKFLNITNSEQWTEWEMQRLLYIIARDNEVENMATIISKHENALIILANESAKKGSMADKWQFTVQLHKLQDKDLALALLEKFVNDEDEYVNRRALMELAKLQSDKVEFYCDKFWNKDKYGEMEEYQRIAVLHSLKEINSKYLSKYIEMAKQDGRKYLVHNALKLEKQDPSV
jgi:hypothetical protein